MYSGSFETVETPGLQDYLKAVQARKLLVILFLLAGLGLAYLFTTNRTATYSASTRVLVNPSPARSGTTGNSRPNLETEREILTSEPIARVVAQEVPDAPSPRDILAGLDVSFRTGSEVLSLTYTYNDPTVTAEVVNGFARTYTQDRIDATAEVYTAERAALASSADGIGEQISAVDAALVDVNDSLGELTPEDTVGADVLRAERTTLSSQRNQLTADLITVQKSLRALTQTEDGASLAAEVLQLADPPSAPEGFPDRLLWIVGGMLGVTLGVIAAFVADRLDTTAREESDVELALGSSVLGSVPPFGRFGGASDGLVMLSDNTSTRTQRAQESFRRLRTSIQFVGNSDGIRSLLLTSSQPAEGKSTVSANLAVALAQAGQTVVLVSADMRRPTLETIFGIRNVTGLSDHLQSDSQSYPPVISIGVENLAILPSGPPPPNPGELLGLPRFKQLIVQLEATYDFVIVDTPPALSAADSAAAAISVGGVLVVVDSKRTDTEALLRVRSDLERSGARVIGALLNKDRSRSTKFWSRRDRYAYERAAATARK